MTVTSQYTLERTYDKEEIAFCHSHNGNAWCAPLTNQQYVDREQALGNTLICNPSQSPDYNNSEALGLTYFVFRDSSIEYKEGANKKTYNIIGGCEGLFRPALVVEYVNGKAVEVPTVSPCIGGVYMQPEYRNGGKAQNMINQLCDELARIGREVYHFSKFFITLYSEVGNYYQRFGFVNRHVPLVRISTETNILDVSEKEYRMVQDFEFKPIMENFTRRLVEDSLSQTEDDHKSRIINLTSEKVLDWHHERARFISKTLDLPSPKYYGLQLVKDNGETDIDNYIAWTYDFKESNFVIVNSQATTFDNLIKLLEFARYECNKYNFKNMILWEYDLPIKFVSLRGSNTSIEDMFKQFRANVTGKWNGRLDIVNGSLSAFKFFDFENESAEVDYENIVWEANGKLVWF